MLPKLTKPTAVPSIGCPCTCAKETPLIAGTAPVSDVLGKEPSVGCPPTILQLATPLIITSMVSSARALLVDALSAALSMVIWH